ncbi:Inner membrane transport protein YeaN [Delftia tsuruhatensis]|uniref:cyanate transporter n=1 Tax=Delftia tsuruhatensis TaxID=180282 RepID=UPI001E7E049D|nr:cyanate transporter [Delftia tsuruhatensis]CAB5704927.1 Inner membrane transport protein YeaN [Delftia tsuruhatensis]CAC9689567.1 Inner membrane transport protein YeaN [Delftia tsuruhatensis]
MSTLAAPHEATPACALAIPTVLWLATVVLVTLNLRPFLNAVGPLGPQIQSATGMGLSTLSWLTLLPMALMGIGAWLAPAALRRLGPCRAVVLSLAVIALGCALRAAGATTPMLLATAALCGAGVALVQGVLPGLIKRQSPTRMAQMMGLYSAALMGGGALGAQLSPLAVQWGLEWRLALALWALPALLAMALAWHALRALPVPAPARAGVSDDTAWLRRRPRTWLLMACFGLINGGYAAMVAWLAPFYQGHGWSPAQSGGLVALLSVAQASAALGLPVLASRHPDRRPWLGFTLLCQVIGLAGLAWWPDTAPLLNTAVLGIGLGGCFALMMVVALDHLPHPAQAGALNALMQGGGFIIAAMAPFVIARLHQSTGGFRAGWMAQLCAVLVVCALAARLAPARYAQVMRAPAA